MMRHQRADMNDNDNNRFLVWFAETLMDVCYTK